jgi:hypothetical protein
MIKNINLAMSNKFKLQISGFEKDYMVQKCQIDYNKKTLSISVIVIENFISQDLQSLINATSISVIVLDSSSQIIDIIKFNLKECIEKPILNFDFNTNELMKANFVYEFL